MIVAVRTDDSRQAVAQAILRRDGGIPEEVRAVDTIRDDIFDAPIADPRLRSDV